jgi:hypothetical protein
LTWFDVQAQRKFAEVQAALTAAKEKLSLDADVFTVRCSTSYCDSAI